MGFSKQEYLWVASFFSRGSAWPRDWPQVSHIAGRLFTLWATRESLRHLNTGTYLLLNGARPWWEKRQPPAELTSMNTPQYFCHHCSCPHSEPQPSLGDLSPQETLQGQKVGLTEAPIKSLLWPWVPKHVKFCGCPLRERTRINLMRLWSINLQQWRQEYTVEKKSLGISDAGKTGWVYVKEWN